MAAMRPQLSGLPSLVHQGSAATLQATRLPSSPSLLATALPRLVHVHSLGKHRSANAIVPVSESDVQLGLEATRTASLPADLAAKQSPCAQEPPCREQRAPVT
jgi:hypothetical protein